MGRKGCLKSQGLVFSVESKNELKSPVNCRPINILLNILCRKTATDNVQNNKIGLWKQIVCYLIKLQSVSQLISLFIQSTGQKGPYGTDNCPKYIKHNKLCAWRHNMPLPPASWQYLRIRQVTPVLFRHVGYDISNKLTFWPWNWCPNHVWRGLPLCPFSLPRTLCSLVRLDVRDRQTSDKSIA